MTNTVILHHHDPSPYAEKIRRLFGLKGLSWASVQIPMVMPKPDLTALTGGYRGTPVLQIGADIYCDTRLIAAEIEARYPEPAACAMAPFSVFSRQHWSDDAVFPQAAALALYENAALLPPELSKDRADYFQNLDFSAFEKDAPYFREQVRAHLALAESELALGRAFLGGTRPTWDDMGLWMITWMIEGNVASLHDCLDGLDALTGWRARMKAVGTGTRTDISAAEAHDMAAGTRPVRRHDFVPTIHTAGYRAGQPVHVTPHDHPGDRVEGTLRALGPDRITLTRQADAFGEIDVHFPRIGYRLTALSP